MCSPLKLNWHFGETCRLHLQGRRISQARNQRESGSKQRSTLKMEATCSSEMSVDFQRTTRRFIPEDQTCPLRPDFRRPYPKNQVCGDDNKSIFNYRLPEAGLISENVAGISAQKYCLCNRRQHWTSDIIEIISWIWVSHSGGCEEFYLLGYKPCSLVKIKPTSRRNI
jgi:hypothetical protein